MLPILLVLTFIVLSLLHVHWAFGGTIGSTATIPIVNNEPLFEPSRMDAWLVALALACCAVLMARLAGWLSWWSPRGRVFRWMGYALSAVFLIRAIGDFKYGGFFKQVQGTEFAHYDTWIYSPLCLFISIAVFLLVRRNLALENIINTEAPKG